MNKSKRIAELESQGFELDLFSTILSRKHSRHAMVGNIRLTKPDYIHTYKEGYYRGYLDGIRCALRDKKDAVEWLKSNP